jgi:hypothetical protein
VFTDRLAVSPLLGLASFRPWFFLRFALCWLHYELEGNFKHHLAVLLQTLSAKDVNGTCARAIEIFLMNLQSSMPSFGHCFCNIHH